MDLTYSPAEESFRERARQWLAEHVPLELLSPPYTPEGVAAHRAWEQQLHSAGYAALHWPREHGGGGAGLIEQALFGEEYVRAGAPVRLNRTALGMAGPTVMAFGTQAQQQRRLPGMLSCDQLWCQGFSEPDAGSDLAAVRTRADIDGTELVITGQKTWTSLSASAQWMFALVRTDPSQHRHRGLTFVMVPIDAPGIELRPIRQLDGEPGFAEVFPTEVRVLVANVVGEGGSRCRCLSPKPRWPRWSSPSTAPTRSVSAGCPLSPRAPPWRRWRCPNGRSWPRPRTPMCWSSRPPTGCTWSSRSTAR